MKVRLPVDPDHRNAVGAVSTSELAPGFDRLKSQVMTSAMAIGALDPVTGELVRWRNARRQDCQLCQSYRDAGARQAGVTDATLAAVDDYESSDLPEAQKAALRFVDAYLDEPADVPAGVYAGLREHYTAAQRAELVLRLFGTTQNRVMRALGLDQGPPAQSH